MDQRRDHPITRGRISSTSRGPEAFEIQSTPSKKRPFAQKMLFFQKDFNNKHKAGDPFQDGNTSIDRLPFLKHDNRVGGMQYWALTVK